MHRKILIAIVALVIVIAVVIPLLAAETLANRFGACEYNVGATNCAWGPIRTVTAYCTSPDIYVYGMQIKEGSPIDDCGINALDEVKD